MNERTETMSFTEQDVKRLLQEALNQAQFESDTGQTTQKINLSRSQSWVRALANQFKKTYEGDPEVRVFTKSDHSHRKDFGLNEMLYDILVCRVGEVESPVHKKILYFIREGLWQVESELAHSTRGAVVDFSKLVLGSAQNKLFIASRGKRGEEGLLLEVLRPVASCCTGDVYIGMIPHPAQWPDTGDDVRLWGFGK